MWIRFQLKFEKNIQGGLFKNCPFQYFELKFSIIFDEILVSNKIKTEWNNYKKLLYFLNLFSKINEITFRVNCNVNST